MIRICQPNENPFEPTSSYPAESYLFTHPTFCSNGERYVEEGFNAEQS